MRVYVDKGKGGGGELIELGELWTALQQLAPKTQTSPTAEPETTGKKGK